jgi:hypothetical protein
MRSTPIQIRCALTVVILAATSQMLDAQVLVQNLLYTSVQPCRLVDTRLATAGALVAGSPRTFNVTGSATGTTFTDQGGHSGGCAIPGFADNFPEAQAVVLNFVAVRSAGPGDLVVWPSDQSQPTASTLNYAASGSLAGLNIANGLVIPIRQDQQGAEITAVAQVSGTHLVADVVGYFSSSSNTNVFLGIHSGAAALPGAIANVGIGRQALEGLTTGTGNVMIGPAAGIDITSGQSNTGVGISALSGISTAADNTALGVSALDSVKTGVGNIAIGAGAGTNLGGAESDNIYIGNAGLGGESGTLRIGTNGTHTATIIQGISGAASTGGDAMFITTGGRIGTVTSSARFKQNVEDIGDSSESLMRLRPVAFRYKPEYDDGSDLQQYGLIAEEVAKVAPDLVRYDETGWPFTVRYHLLNALLLNEVQKQHRQAAAQQEQIHSQTERIAVQAEEDARQRRLIEAQRQEIDAQKTRIDRIEQELKLLAQQTGHR